MSPELQDLITRIAAAAKAWHALEQGITDADVLINGTDQWIAQLTQTALDSVPSFAAIHLQVAQITDTLYMLKTMNAIPAATNIASWVKLANMS